MNEEQLKAAMKAIETEVFTIKDSKAETYAPPFYAKNKFDAMRNVEAWVNDPKYGNLASHPEDFTIFAIGTFNPSNGLLDGYKETVSIINCAELSKKQKEI